MKEWVIRAASGLVYVLLILVFTQFLPLSILLFGFALISVNELFRLFDLPQKGSVKSIFYLGMVLSFLPFLLLDAYLLIPEFLTPINNVMEVLGSEKVILFVPFALVINLIYLTGRRSNQRGWALPFIYVVLPLILAIDFQNQNKMQLALSPVLMVFVIIWCSDTFAFVTGKLFGKSKIAPAISPGKTWEGAFGGLFFACLAALLLQINFIQDQISFILLILGVVWIVVAGILGDLLESKFKRTKGLKDSGNIMPGHGGILDRLDSFLLAMPVAYLYFGLIL